jgi:hypothetical protein
MQLMRAAARTVFIDFKPTRVIAAVLHRGVIAFLTLCARQMNDWANIFFL